MTDDEIELLILKNERLERANRKLKKQVWIIWNRWQRAIVRYKTAESELKQFRRYWWCFKRELGIHMDAVPFAPDDNEKPTHEQALNIIDEIRRFAAPHVKRLNSRKVKG